MAGTRPLCKLQSIMPTWTSETFVKGVTNRVYFKVPWLSRCVEINDDFVILETQLLDHNVSAMGPGTPVVRVKRDLWCGSVGGHD